MQFICKHDPTDPNHLICETQLPWKHWAVEIGLGILALVLVIGSILFLVKGRGVEKFIGRPVAQLQGSFLGPLPIAFEEKNEDISQQYSGQSGFSLVAEARYYSAEEEQFGRGPWPPQAEQETKLVVFLKPGGLAPEEPEARPLSIVLTGKLGTGVEWTGFAPVGQGLSYLPSARLLRWIIKGDPSSGISEIGSPDIAIFEVAITPTLAQIQENQLFILEDLKIAYNAQTTLFPHVVITW